MSRKRSGFSWVLPFDIPVGRRLRILIYARYSTEDQNPRSIDDQVAAVRRFLKTLDLNANQMQIEVLSDAAISGEVISRPGIDAARERIRTGRIDWLVTEEASRFFARKARASDWLEKPSMQTFELSASTIGLTHSMKTNGNPDFLTLSGIMPKPIGTRSSGFDEHSSPGMRWVLH